MTQEPGKYWCESCKKNFKQNYNLQRHQQQVHENFKFICNECGKQYRGKQSLPGIWVVLLIVMSQIFKMYDLIKKTFWPHFGFPHLKIHWTSPDKDDALLNNLENVQGDEEDYFGGSSQCIIKIQNLQNKIQISTLSVLDLFFQDFSFIWV